jgi:hypothetical protein
MYPTELPQISNTPTQHPDCCASLSTTLIDNVIACCPTLNATVASIGCGSGLLEALLVQQLDSLKPLQSFHIKIAGIEVKTCQVKYLQFCHRVQGTWDKSEAAFRADVWLFVYPRNPNLIDAYLKVLDEDSQLKTIIWIGPTCDWADFKMVFLQRAWVGHSVFENGGLAEYETMVSITRKPANSANTKTTVANIVPVVEATKDELVITAEAGVAIEAGVKIEPVMDIDDI